MQFSGCFGGGGGGDDPPTLTLTVSGQVLAPNGQIADNKTPGLLQQFFHLTISVARAEVSGLLPVADNTQVELVRIFDNGAVENTISTTTTTGGNYTFNLQTLGIEYSSDLVVRVSGVGGIQLRAFVTKSEADIGPVSEAVMRLILEQISMTAGSSLTDVTISEINDLVDSIDFLSSLKYIQSDIDIETTINFLLSNIKQDSGITDFLLALVEPGQSALGTGDVGNLLPFEQNNIWNRLVVDSEQTYPYLSTVKISGTKLIGSALTTVFQFHNFDNSGIISEEYSVKDSHGVTNWGNNWPDDTFTPLLVPYQQVKFPLVLGDTQQIINRSDLMYPQDLDYDGQNETFDVTATVTPVGTENITVQSGVYSQSLRLDVNINLKVMLSSQATTITSNEALTQWLNTDVGVIKESINILTEGPGGSISNSSTAELLGYYVAGSGKGILPRFTVVSDTSIANSDTTHPGRAGVATDGNSYLVVTCRDAAIGNPSGLVGVFVSENNTVSSEFAIATHDCTFPWPSIAYSGTDYLVAFGRNGAIMGVIVSPSGAVGSEFMISPDSSSNFSPRVAHDGTNYLVVWGRYVGDYDIYGAIVSPTGSIINALTVFSAVGEQVSPAVAYNGSNYLVSWRDTRDGSGPSLTTDIYGARINPDGTVLDSAGIAIATASGYQGEPEVASDGENFFVTWLYAPTLGTSPVPDGVFYGKLINAGGNLIGSLPSDSGIVINASPYGKGGSALAFDGTNYLFAWRVGAFNNLPPAGLYATHVSTSGVLLDGPADSVGLTVTGMPPDFSKYVYPTISSSANHSLLMYSNNIELSGQLKSIEATYIYP